MSFFTTIFINLFVLTNTLFLYSVFLIRPIKTLKGKKNLAKGAMIIGGILIILPLIGMLYILFTLFQVFMLSILYLTEIIPFILLLIPGVVLFIHRWFLYKNPRTDNI